MLRGPGPLFFRWKWKILNNQNIFRAAVSTCTKYTYFLKKVQYTSFWQKYSTVQNAYLYFSKSTVHAMYLPMYFFNNSEIRSFGMATPTEMIGPTKLEFEKIKIFKTWNHKIIIENAAPNSLNYQKYKSLWKKYMYFWSTCTA